MDIKHQSLVLDINETRNYTFIKACQGDQKSRYIDCTLTQNGSVLRLTSNYRAIVKASINNEVKAINSCTIDTNSQVVVVELTSTMLDTPGVLNCEITVQDGQQIVTSQAFAVQVRQSTVANETEIKKSKEYGALVDALSSIADVESKADKVQGLVDNIDKLESANDIVTRLSNVESKETQLETQHKTDVQALTDKANSIVDQANTDRQNFNNSVDEINTTLDTKENVSNKVSEITHPSLDYYPDTKAVFDYVNSKLETPLSDIESLKADKLDKVDFNSYKTSNDNAVNSKVDTTDFNNYKTATDKAVGDNTDNIKLLDTNKANLVQSKNLFDMTSYLNFLNALAARAIINGTLDNIDSSSFTFTTTGHDCYTNGWVASFGTAFKIQVQQNTTYTMSWDFSGSDGYTFVFFNGTPSGSGNVVQTKNSKMKLTFTTKEDTTFVTVRFGITDGGTSATIGKIQVEEGTESTTYLPSMVSEGVNEIDKAVADNIESIKINTIDIANNSALFNQNLIKAITDKVNNVTINDSSNGNIIGLTLYGKSTQNTIPTPTNPVDINDINNPSITFSNDSDSQSINTQCTLRGIENVYDTLTVNSDGTGYITQRLFVERITSQSNPTSSEWKYSNITYRFFRNDSSYSFDVKDNKPLILCSHLDVGENENNTTFDNSIGWINVGGVGIAIRMTEFDGNISAFKNWLDDNEVYVLAPRSKPITVNLSKEQVDKILSLHTYFPNTTIVADTDCQVTYIADTKNYIDNKILEVATAMVAHESEVM